MSLIDHDPLQSPSLAAQVRHRKLRSCSLTILKTDRLLSLSLSLIVLSLMTIDLIVFEERRRALREINLGFKYGSGLGNIQTLRDYLYP